MAFGFLGDETMCIVTGAVTTEFGVLATDSAQYDTENSKMTYESPKMFGTANNKYVVSYIGTNLYLADLDYGKFDLPLNALSLYLSEYLTRMKPKVEALMKSEIADEDDQKPHICLYVMGMFKKTPTIAMFNVFKDFTPQYVWTKDKIKFISTLYGGEVPGKKEVFKKTTSYMEKKAERFADKLSSGIVSEILTRGIYKKADLEQKIGDKEKYAGGAVCVAMVNNAGLYFPSGVQLIKVK